MGSPAVISVWGPSIAWSVWVLACPSTAWFVWMASIFNGSIGSMASVLDSGWLQLLKAVQLQLG
jgi:hypothetical protein